MSYQGPSIDHSLLSPCGRISRRAKSAYMARWSADVEAWFRDKYPEDHEAEYMKRLTTHREMQLRHAMMVRDLAERGMCTKRYNREADRIEAENAHA